MTYRKFKSLVLFVILTISISACDSASNKEKLFTLLSQEDTGIDFSNDLSFDGDFNIYKYRNFYNGGGVSIGDINNDGLPDIYLTANQKENRLYLNKGNFVFEDITEKSGTAGTRAWATGVTMADVNADGLLDIYVCNSGDVKGDNKQNELFINNGDLTFTESAEAYNLADPGYTTHSSFFDFDKDGDLDVYILNNSYQAIGSFDLRRNERPKRNALGGDKLMENVDGKFIDISEKAGIYGSVIGFGLGVTVGDVNGDSWDDIYVSNDFFERDYLYINNQDGTFTEELTDQMNSISGASMGADMADVNNDGKNDLFVTEMLPSDYNRLKTVTTFEDWNRYQYGVNNGYYHQFTRNTFQINNGNSSFSELGRFAGVEATDWSWGALIFDMDNDGFKDLFVANGIYQDLTNQDYIQYASSEEVVKTMTSGDKVDYKKLVEIIPSNPVQNHAFRNTNGSKFEDKTGDFGLDQPSFSNGSAYGDLDNDGDLDLVVNNVNMPSFIYRNNADLTENNNYLKLILKGNAGNPFAVGTKIWITGQEGDRYYVEQQPIRGFQSSMDPRPLIGLKSAAAVDLKIVWPSGRTTEMSNVAVNQTLTIDEAEGSAMNLTVSNANSAIFQEDASSVDFAHVENEFVDFNIDRSLYLMRSTQGPKMSKGDVNGDGLEDIFVGGSKEYPAAILMASEDGYQVSQQEEIAKHAISEDSESIFFDADNDGDLDLYVCSGSIEFSASSSAFIDRLYLNDGAGNFSHKNQMVPSQTSFVTSSTVSVGDFDGDGDQDLFVGEGAQPMKNGVPGDGYILQNDGTGSFTDVTDQVAPGMRNLGMITSSSATDIDSDGDVDMVVVGEFMGIRVFENNGGSFSEASSRELNETKGWWNVVHSSDLDGDGDMDFVLGNHGLNSRFRASKELPIVLYTKDFDKNGSLDPILAKYGENGQAYPYGLRHNLIDQISGLKKLFPDYESFKDASVQTIFTKEQMQDVIESEANTMSSVILINKGGFDFDIVELPAAAQTTPIYAISTGDYDRDGDTDILLGGNLYSVKPEVGRYDASYGTLLLNNGNLSFEAASNDSGFFVQGEMRDILTFDGFIIVSRNNDSILKFNY